MIYLLIWTRKKNRSIFPCSIPTPRRGRRTRYTWRQRRSSTAVRCNPENIPPPKGNADGPLQILVANLDYSDYLGRLAIARVFNGKMFTGEEVAIAKLDGSIQKTKITKLFSFSGLKRTDITETELGDIVAVAGVEGITIGETITNVENPAPLPHIAIDEPTIAMLFTVNTSHSPEKTETM